MTERSTLALSLLLATLIVAGVLAGAMYLLKRPDATPALATARPSTPERAALRQDAPPPLPAGTIFRCEVDGEISYSQQPCAQGTTKVVDVQSTRGFRPPNVSSTAQPGNQPIERSIVASNAGESRAANNAPLCKAIAEYIASIDAQARQPQSAAGQDILRTRRHEAVQRWADAKCHGPI